MNCICQCDESLYGIQSRQDTDFVLKEVTPIPRLETRTSAPFRVDGQSVLRIMGRGAGPLIADGDLEIRVEEAQVCKDVPNAEDFREVARFVSKEDPEGNQYISTKYSPNGTFVRFVEVGPSVAPLITSYAMRVIAQPIGCCDPGAWSGIGSPAGPGTRVSTKADLVVPAGVSIGVIVAADLVPGTRRMTIRNVGAGAIRFAESGAAGAGRGVEFLSNETFTFGTHDGALALLDGFSVAGTTLAFFFELD